MKKYKNYIISFIIYTLVYFGLPAIIMQSTDLSGVMFFLLLILNPLVTLIISAIFSQKRFDHIVGLIPATVFFITLILLLNQSAWVYCAAYYLIAMLGNYIGYKIKKIK